MPLLLTHPTCPHHSRFMYIYLLVSLLLIYQLVSTTYSGSHHLDTTARKVLTAILLGLLSLLLLVPLGAGGVVKTRLRHAGSSKQPLNLSGGEHRPHRDGATHTGQEIEEEGGEWGRGQDRATKCVGKEAICDLVAPLLLPPHEGPDLPPHKGVGLPPDLGEACSSSSGSSGEEEEETLQMPDLGMLQVLRTPTFWLIFLQVGGGGGGSSGGGGAGGGGRGGGSSMGMGGGGGSPHGRGWRQAVRESTSATQRVWVWL